MRVCIYECCPDYFSKNLFIERDEKRYSMLIIALRFQVSELVFTADFKFLNHRVSSHSSQNLRVDKSIFRWGGYFEDRIYTRLKYSVHRVCVRIFDSKCRYKLLHILCTSQTLLCIHHFLCQYELCFLIYFEYMLFLKLSNFITEILSRKKQEIVL